MDHHGPVVGGKPDDLLEKIQVDALRGRVVGKGKQNHSRRDQ